MTNPTISDALRLGADLFDQADTRGLPTNVSITASRTFNLIDGEHVELKFQFYGDDFADVDGWAAWLGESAERRVTNEGATEFADAYLYHSGIRLRLTGNRSVAEAKATA